MTARELPEVRDERAAHAHELLLERLRALTTSDEWLAMLKMSRRFHSYSARNVLLLLAQARRDVSPVTAPGKPSLRRAAEPAKYAKAPAHSPS